MNRKAEKAKGKEEQVIIGKQRLLIVACPFLSSMLIIKTINSFLSTLWNNL
jgi:hypothetical protein